MQVRVGPGPTRGSMLVIAAALLLAFAPEAGPLQAVRVLARYLLAAYLPGLVVWRALRPGDTGLLDVVLLPSLLSVLPFCWLVMAGMALGLDPAAAAWAAVLPFAVAGVLLGTGPAPSRDRRELWLIAAACAVACLLLVAPFASNAFAASAWDGPLHAAIATRVLAGGLAPDSAIVAGQPGGYYWLYHLHAAALSELTGLGLYQVFALVSVHSFVLFALAGYRLAARLAPSFTARLAGVGLLIFGLNPFGWLLFLRNSARHVDPWQPLLVPLEMVDGYPGQLGSLIHQFLDGNPFAASFAFGVLWLDRAVGWIEGERGARNFLIGVLVLASTLYLHSFSGGFLLAASAAAVALARRLGRGLFGMMACAGLLTLPYAFDVLREKTRNPVRLVWSLDFLSGQLLAMTASLGLLAIVAAPAFGAAWRAKGSGRLFLSLYCVVLAAAALVTRTPANTQYKLLYLALPALAALAAAAWETWQAKPAGRAFFVLALVLGMPTNVLTSCAFAMNPPRETLAAEKQRLYAWVRQATPPDSVFALDPDRDTEGLSEAQRLYSDREWFEIPIYGRRRTLAGYTSDVLSGEWGYRDIARRQRLASDLTQGRALRPWQQELLRELRAPIYVLVRAPKAAPETFAPEAYRLVYERDGTRVYRLAP